MSADILNKQVGDKSGAYGFDARSDGRTSGTSAVYDCKYMAPET